MSDNQLETIFKKDKELVYDKYFINHVYKKTERVCNASFYLAENISDKDKIDISNIREEIYKTTSSTLKIVSDMLVCDTSTMRQPAAALTGTLYRLSSLLMMAATSERIPQSHAALLQYEIDALIVDVDEARKRVAEVRITRSSQTRMRRTSFETTARYESEDIAAQATAPLQHTALPDRKQRIKDIVRSKGQVGIKDISDVIKDVSEKSIQRDLNDLIDVGEIVRLGERRWSTYKLA